MKGYVRNKMPVWTHALKRAIAPNEKIDLETVYEQYGKKYNLKPDKDFVKWLREVKLRDTFKWEIVMFDEDTGADDIIEIVEETPKTKRTPKTNEMTVADVVTLSVRKAYGILPRIRDQKLLKYHW